MKARLSVFGAVIIGLLWFHTQRAMPSPQDAQPDKGPIAKVKVHKEGGISLDGGSVTIKELRARLEKLKEADGVVWYYRESSDKQAEEAGDAVIKIIIELKLPVRLMEDDFD